ncbi:MAG: ribbon-helix-helix protein, CopG family [Actinobacteria bacterium]|nr:ribbon-helix-helix protein, CopG family [Actinomycetota bacterium]NBR67129.1 ribbon-helix-helix protein, CopG family [Actinomycetota bacterium]
MARKQELRITLDLDILEWLKAEADRRRVSMSHIIRELLLREMPAESKAR